MDTNIDRTHSHRIRRQQKISNIAIHIKFVIFLNGIKQNLAIFSDKHEKNGNRKTPRIEHLLY